MLKASVKGLLVTGIALFSASSFAGEGFDDFLRNRGRQDDGIFKPDVIYGEDDRTDWYDFKSEELKVVARSSAALIRKDKLTRGAEGTVKIAGQPYGEEMQMCSTERFVTQPTATFCSGFLAAPDKIVTAGHCIQGESDCERTAFVFDFTMFDANYDPTNVPATAVYNCKKVVHTVLEGQHDFAIVQLDRAVEDRQPVNVRREGKIADFSEVIVLGYPHGIPLKSSIGKVRSNEAEGFFSSTLDTYGGNSGSMVVDSKTHVVEGILVRGEPDVVWDGAGQCYKSKICSETECYGEESSRIIDVVPYLDAAFLWN
jgi:hypothetical protein